MGRAMAHGVVAKGRYADPTALALLSDDARATVLRELGENLPRGWRARARRGYLQMQALMMAARTVEIDEAIVAAGASQLVILGAGLDGRAWRLPALEKVSVFEVDHPDSQREKRARAAKLEPVSCDIRFVPVDFERDALADALRNAGCDLRQPVFFSWLGVTLYLTEPAIFDTLCLVASLPSGSGIVFDYGVRPDLLEPLERAGVEFFARRYAEQGEPWLSFFDPAELCGRMRGLGFSMVEDFGRNALETRYFAGRDDKLRLGGGTHLMLACN